MRRSGSVLLAAGLVFALSHRSPAQEVEFASQKDAIIKALKGQDGVKVVDGQKYEVQGGQVYKILPGGMKAKMRGLGGVVQVMVSPKVALPIQFQVNSDEPSPAGEKLLRELGAALESESLRGAKFVITGHTDGDGEEGYNLELSRKRAERVKAFLVKQHKLPLDRLQIQAHGESQPIAGNESEEGKAKNRRVEVTRLLEQ